MLPPLTTSCLAEGRSSLARPRSARRPFIALLLGLMTILAAAVESRAQVDSISASPNAVLLRHIWVQIGDYGAEVGAAVAALWDIDGDGRDEFGVAERGDPQWTVYGLDAQGIARVHWRCSFASPDRLFGGNFRGDGHRLLVHPWVRDTAILGRLYFLDIYSADSGRIADAPSLHWQSRSPGVRLIAARFHVADLDLDGADELIVSAASSNRNGTPLKNGEIWIYRGGPGFQVDTPTVVIRDTEVNGGEYALHIGRVDGDEYPDLVCVTWTGGRIRWGSPDLLALERPVDRTFVIPAQWLSMLDADGDSRADFLWYQGYMHLSSSGKNPRARAFDLEDAERHFVGRGTFPIVVGPLNDSASHYDMFSLNTGYGDNVELQFSGSAGGPDARYDAWYSYAADGLPTGFAFQYYMPAGDVDANGWRDFIAGNNRLPGGLSVAVVLAGGPYIPRDSMPASAIRDIAIGAHRDAITVWPNPADDLVHIAWRGDLSRTPARFAVHDLLGRLVARGEADTLRGEVLWHCADRAAGIYLLTIVDASGGVIATTALTKR